MGIPIENKEIVFLLADDHSIVRQDGDPDR